MENLKKYAIWGIGAIVALIIFIQVISVSNQEVRTKNLFNAQMQERTAFYDNMYKTIAQQKQIALKNDTSFRANINIVMSGRKDGEQIMMKWVKETNPNADYKEVSKLYEALFRTVEAKRDGFFEQERQLQDINRVHEDLLGTFPAGFILSTIMGRKSFVYKPITSSQTDEVFKTGKDDNVNLDL